MAATILTIDRQKPKSIRCAATCCVKRKENRTKSPKYTIGRHDSHHRPPKAKVDTMRRNMLLKVKRKPKFLCQIQKSAAAVSAVTTKTPVAKLAVAKSCHHQNSCCCQIGDMYSADKTKIAKKPTAPTPKNQYDTTRRDYHPEAKRKSEQGAANTTLRNAVESNGRGPMSLDANSAQLQNLWERPKSC